MRRFRYAVFSAIACFAALFAADGKWPWALYFSLASIGWCAETVVDAIEEKK